jgi:hypothetical protein
VSIRNLSRRTIVPGEHYPLIEAEKAEDGNVAKACALMKVSRSADYERSQQQPSCRHLADAELMVKGREVFGYGTWAPKQSILSRSRSDRHLGVGR